MATATTVDATRRAAIYTAFMGALPLHPGDAAALQTERGLSPATIAACQFRSTRDPAAVTAALAASGASDEELIEVGLLVPDIPDPRPAPFLTEQRVLIPYLERDGATVTYLRAHKFGPKGVPIGWYSPWLAHAHPADTLVITEGEFKAAALYQWGLAAIGLPGIASFSGKHLERLREAVAALHPKRVVIAFDHEIKYDPEIPARFKAEWQDRYDTEVYSALMAHHLRDHGARIVRLPIAWMGAPGTKDAGKADWDGALAQGRTRDEVDAVLAGALSIPEFFAALDAIHHGEPAKVARREFYRRTGYRGDGRLTERTGPMEPRGYLWTTLDRSGQPVTTGISNFTLRYERMVHHEETSETEAERIVRIVNYCGEVGEPVSLRPKDINAAAAFRRWAAAQGPYTWTGNDATVLALCTHMDAQDTGDYILRTARVGEIQPGVWLFQNGLIHGGQIIRPSPRDNVCWVGRQGYMVEDDDCAQPRLLNPTPVRDLDATHAAFLEAMRANYRGSALPWLGIGWGLATLFRSVLFNEHGFFPHLYCWGEKGSGKTTFCRWIMAGLFGIDTEGKPLGSTEKHSARLLAKRCALPAWFDEMRDSKMFDKHVAMLTSAYNGQGYGRAVRSGDLRTDHVPVRGSVLVGGINPPRDESLASRCIYLPFSVKGRERDSFGDMKAGIGILNDLLTSTLLHYDQLAPQIRTAVHRAAEALWKETGQDRLSLNWAMPLAAFQVVCGPLVDCTPLYEFAEVAVAGAEASLAEEHPVMEFWRAVEALAPHPVGKDYLGRDEQGRVLVWMSGLFSVYAKDYRQRVGDLPQLREPTLRALIAEQPYFVEHSRRRVKGALRRVVVLSPKGLPEPLEAAMQAVGLFST